MGDFSRGLGKALTGAAAVATPAAQAQQASQIQEARDARLEGFRAGEAQLDRDATAEQGQLDRNSRASTAAADRLERMSARETQDNYYSTKISEIEQDMDLTALSITEAEEWAEFRKLYATSTPDEQEAMLASIAPNKDEKGRTTLHSVDMKDPDNEFENIRVLVSSNSVTGVSGRVDPSTLPVIGGRSSDGGGSLGEEVELTGAPSAAKNEGKIIKDDTTEKLYKAVGGQWREWLE
jgi:hypothetical protein